MRPTILLALATLAILAALACDRSPNPDLRPFDDYQTAAGAELTTPISATAAQRRHDARSRDAWRRILDRLEGLVKAIEEGRRLCVPGNGGTNDTGDDARLTAHPDPASFGRLRSRVETEGERLKTDIAQLDPTGDGSALFLPARRLNRLVGTVLMSTLEISCGTKPVLDARIASARRQLQVMRDYLDAL